MLLKKIFFFSFQLAFSFELIITKASEPQCDIKTGKTIFKIIAEEEKNGEIDPGNSVISLFFTKIKRIKQIDIQFNAQFQFIPMKKMEQIQMMMQKKLKMKTKKQRKKKMKMRIMKNYHKNEKKRKEKKLKKK